MQLSELSLHQNPCSRGSLDHHHPNWIFWDRPTSSKYNQIPPYALASTTLLSCRVLQLSAAAAYFGLDDVQKDTYLGGYLMAAFFLVGAPAALLVSPCLYEDG